MTPLEPLEINIRYGQSDKRKILLELLPDASNINEVANAHNLPIEIVLDWYDLSERVLGAYRLDEHRNPGFLLAQISG
jgi:hypothetical protein